MGEKPTQQYDVLTEQGSATMLDSVKADTVDWPETQDGFLKFRRGVQTVALWNAKKVISVKLKQES